MRSESVRCTQQLEERGKMYLGEKFPIDSLNKPIVFHICIHNVINKHIAFFKI